MMRVNKQNPRDDFYKTRVYSETKERAMKRAEQDGDSLGYLVACFLEGYASGYVLPEWLEEQIAPERKSPVSTAKN